MFRLIFLAALASATLSAQVRFGISQAVFDLRNQEWQYLPEAAAATPQQTVASAEWKPVRVGMRWDEMGYPALKKGNFWVRFTFTADETLRARKTGFFATLIDDEADIFLNNEQIATVKYSLGALVRGPAIADFSSHLRYGKNNVLLLHVRDTYVRSPGLIGNVCLFQTLPYRRTAEGGIDVDGPGPFAVLLHLGDALLSNGKSTAFTRNDLAALSLPPYALRDDELVLVLPRREVRSDPRYRVDAAAIHPIRDNRPLDVVCGPLPATVGRYEFIDLPVELTAAYANAFDPRQIKLQAFIQTPSGRVEKVPGFFRQDFEQHAPSSEEEILLPVPGPAWHVYYRPRELGTFEVQLIAEDKSGIRKYDAGQFRSVQSGLPGYLRVSKRDPSFFEYDNGASFFGIGPSGWFRGRDYIFGGDTRWVSSRNLDAYYQRKAASGSTYEYLGSFHFGQLLINGGIIDQHVAWKLEHALRTLEHLGIRWLFFHDDVLRMSRYGLDALPYAATNGGSARDLNEVYFGQSVMDMQKDELRYLIGRMADSPSLWIWNIGDEWSHQPGNKFSTPMVRSWIAELHASVKQLDIYHHPHAIGEGRSSILSGGDVYLLEDWYLREISGASTTWKEGHKRDLIDFVPHQTAAVGERPFPLVNVEGGIYGWNSTIYQSGKPWGYPEAITFHQHLWLGLFMKNAVSGTDWLVNVLDHDAQLYHAKAFSNFLRGESLTAAPFQMASPSTTDPRLAAFALVNGNKTLAWAVNRTWNWRDQVEGRSSQTLSGQSIEVPVFRDGTFAVELWNTFSGAVDSTLSLTATNGKLTVPLPDVQKDIALKCFLK